MEVALSITPPPCRIMAGATAWVQLSTPLRLIDTTRSKYAFSKSVEFNEWISSAYSSYELLNNDLHSFPLVDKRAEICKEFIFDNCKIDEYTNILEIGSNRGDFLAYLKSEFPHLQVLGIESSRLSMVGVPTVFNDIRNIQLSPSFDLIVLRQLLEHIPDPVTFLKHISSFLNENAYILIEVPDLENDLDEGIEPWVMEHVSFYSRESIYEIGKKAGLNLVSVSRQEQLLALFTNSKIQVNIDSFNRNGRFERVKTFSLRVEECKKELSELYRKGYEFCFYGASNVFLSMSGELKQAWKEEWENSRKTLLDDFNNKQSRSVNGLVVQSLDNSNPIGKCVYIICAMNRDHHKKMFFNLKNRLKPDDKVYIMWNQVKPEKFL